MSAQNVSLRKATPDDAKSLAELVNFAGDGLPFYLWEQMAEEGQNAWEVGCQRAQREESDFSYLNSTLAVNGGEIVAGLIGYPIGEEPGEVTPETPPIFVPLIELENEAQSSWYINVLAAYPEFRGQGIGSMLLRKAEDFAHENERQILSLIVSDANTNAIRLYERNGFQAKATRPLVKDKWDGAGETWILMIKQLA